MLAYLQGIRPGGRRNASPRTPQSPHPDLTKTVFGGGQPREEKGLSDPPFRSHNRNASQTAAVVVQPPILLPIPRIASRYGLRNSSQDTLLSDNESEKSTAAPIEQLRRVEQEGITNASSTLPNTFVPHVKSTAWRSAGSLNGDQSRYPDRAGLSQSPFGSRDSVKDSLQASSEPISSKIVYNRDDTKGKGRNQATAHSTRGSSYTSLQTASTSSTQARHSKVKLNLLKPMSLLARRRASQAATQISDGVYIQGGRLPLVSPKLPDDYDPRIRGKVVHDFSAPKTNYYSPSLHPISLQHGRTGETQPPGQDEPNSRPQSASNRAFGSHGQSTQSGEPPVQHSPIFREHFGDDAESWRLDEEDRRNQHSPGFANRLRMEDSYPTTFPLPPFARAVLPSVEKDLDLPGRVPPVPPKGSPSSVELELSAPNRSPPPTPFNEPLSAVAELSSLDLVQQAHSQKQFPERSTSKPRSRALSIADLTAQSTSFPKRLPSTASRFSFDLAGVGSAAQENLLEEKHRQQSAKKALEKLSTGRPAANSNDDDMDSPYDCYVDDIHFNDDFEERIPGVNADTDDDLIDEFPQSTQALGFVYTSNLPSVDYTECLSDDDTFPCGLEVTHDQSHGLAISSSIPSLPPTKSHDPTLQEAEMIALKDFGQYTPVPIIPIAIDSQKILKEDELYFDDGMIDIDDENGPKFDESLFDDDTSSVYGLPLRDLKPIPRVSDLSMTEASNQSTRPTSLESGAVLPAVDQEVMTEPVEVSLPNIDKALPSNIRDSQSLFLEAEQSTGLTRDNLLAYHTALAVAANRAARDGKFDRSPRLDEATKHDEAENVRTRVGFDEQVVNRPRDLSKSQSLLDNPVGFESEDDQDDDAVIAAANAQALENDDEGFYGQEFGFYADANGTGEVEYANGGYFGPGAGVQRSHSGRANFQEPSLTPITERSEWSRRNSMISLALQGIYASPVQSPGLAEIADLLQYEKDNNISMSMLLKLRRGAWGGSNSSLRSSAGSNTSGSPNIIQHHIAASATLNGGVHNSNHQAGSTYSLANPASEVEDSEPTSSMLPVSTEDITLNASGVKSPSDLESSLPRNIVTKSLDHSRTNSGVESISYVKEVNEDGGGQWVVEKRRTVEGGQIEILGREVLRSGTI